MCKYAYRHLDIWHTVPLPAALSGQLSQGVDSWLQKMYGHGVPLPALIVSTFVPNRKLRCHATTRVAAGADQVAGGDGHQGLLFAGYIGCNVPIRSGPLPVFL